MINGKTLFFCAFILLTIPFFLFTHKAAAAIDDVLDERSLISDDKA